MSVVCSAPPRAPGQHASPAEETNDGCASSSPLGSRPERSALPLCVAPVLRTFGGAVWRQSRLFESITAPPPTHPPLAVLRVGVNRAAAGSSYVEMGSTKVMAAVYGPREAPPRGGAASGDATASGALECAVQLAPFAVRPRRPRGGATVEAGRQASQVLDAALRPALLLARYPKALIEVHALVLEADGGEGAACLVAAALAVADAGIEMVDLPAAMCVAGHAVRAHGGSGGGGGGGGGGGRGGGGGGAAAALGVDPDAREAAAADFALSLALMPRAELLTHVAHAGEAPPEDLLAALRLAMDGCVGVYDAMRETLLTAARRQLDAVGEASMEAPEADGGGARTEARPFE